MRILLTSALIVVFSGAAMGQAVPANATASSVEFRANDQASASPTTTTAESPITSMPYTPGLDTEFMDRSVDPCVDFYQYSCGGWIKKNPIPADQPGWEVYSKLAQDNEQFLWGILDDLARNPSGR